MSSYLMPWQRQVVDEVERSRREVESGSNSRGILVLGPSGVGKTHLFDAIAAAYPPSLDGVQQVSPCVRIDMKSKPDAASISRGLLAQCGRPMPGAMSEHEMATHMALRARRVRIVLMEEMHNSLLSGASAMRKQNADYLKNLWNNTPKGTPLGWAGGAGSAARHSLVIVLSATEELRLPFTTDEELRSRFGTVFVAPRLALYPPQRLKQFRMVLREMAQRLGLADVIDANDDRLAVPLLLACDGHLRELEQILTRTRLLRADGSDQPPAQLLETAFSAVATTRYELANPFVFSDDAPADKVAQAKEAYERAQQAKERRRGTR